MIEENRNTQTSLAGGGINEEEKLRQAKKAEMKKKYRLMSIALIAIIIVAGVFFAKSIWTGWISSSGNRYYYIKGEKVIGLATIENKQYFFDDSGAMQTGWQTVDGSTYYFGNDGIMQTGFQTINGSKYYLGDSGVLHTGWLSHKNQTYYCSYSNGGKIATGKWTIDGENYYFNNDGIMTTGAVEISANNVYYFDDNGHFQYCEITQNNIGSSWVDERVTFTNRGGGQTRSDYRKLDTPLEGVLSLSGNFSIAEMEYGNCDGQWQLHVRTSNGKWKRIGFFEVKDGKGQFEFVLDDPVSFDAYACTGYESKRWSGRFYQDLNTVTYRTYDFGSNIKTE